MCGGPPAPPKFGDKVVAAIKWVDGTVIDCVREVEIKGPLAGMIEAGASVVIKRMLSEFLVKLDERCAVGTGVPQVDEAAAVSSEGWWRKLVRRFRRATSAPVT